MDRNLIKNVIKEEIDNVNNNMMVEKMFSDFAFQKQFILDCINNIKKVPRELTNHSISNEFNHDDNGRFNLDLTFKVVYKSIVFNVIMYSVNGVEFEAESKTTHGDYLTPNYTDSYMTHIEWLDITPTITDTDDNEVNFSIFDKLDPNTKELFIKSFTYEYLRYNTLDFKFKL